MYVSRLCTLSGFLRSKFHGCLVAKDSHVLNFMDGSLLLDLKIFVLATRLLD